MLKNPFDSYLVDPDHSGRLDPRSLEELTVSHGDSQDAPGIVKMRDSMGWPAVDITTHELVIEDKIIKGHIPTRFYRKKELVGKCLPILVYIHGGGFFGGSIANVEQICRAFADKADLAVVSVGYRLAPEAPFPAGLLDCYNVIASLATESEIYQIDPSQIFVSGDSAGGNFTLTVGFLDRAVFGTNYIAKLLAYYPATTCHTNGEGELWDSTRIYVKDSKEREIVSAYIKGFSSQDISVDEWYAGKVNKENPLISPLDARDEMLRSLPPIQVILGEFDPLRLQVEALLKRFDSLDISYEYKIYNGMVHAFMDKIGDYAQAEQGVKDGLEFLMSPV